MVASADWMWQWRKLCCVLNSEEIEQPCKESPAISVETFQNHWQYLRLIDAGFFLPGELYFISRTFDSTFPHPFLSSSSDLCS